MVKDDKVLDAGYRERQALLNWWTRGWVSELRNPKRVPFWRMLEEVRYDASRDEFVLQDGARVTVADAAARGHENWSDETYAAADDRGITIRLVRVLGLPRYQSTLFVAAQPVAEADHETPEAARAWARAVLGTEVE